MKKDEFLRKLNTFIRNENFAKIDEIIKKFREENNLEMICTSSQAFINLYEYNEAIKILDAIKDEYSENGEFCVRYAMALYNSNKEDKSLEWFEKAKEKGIKEIDETSSKYYPKSIDEWIKRAKLWGPRRIEKNNFEKELREKRNKKLILEVNFDKNVLKGLWYNDEYSLKEYVGKTPTDEDFVKVEKELGYRLPESYKALMRIQNGGLLRKNTFEVPFQRDWSRDLVDVMSIYGVDSNKIYSLCGEFGNKLWIEEWKYPNIGIAICGTMTGGHDMIFLDYLDCEPEGEPCVVHIDQEGDYEITYLADNFKEFVEGLFEYKEDEDD
ncbi:SMI1/KNR4 family protein [Fusobacterium nucleatum]|uniref:SMI1/KNR4 family protein n=1 Tax=Fusobacterium nucleatum TaxID=851 RepID=UPI000404826F|nr:SMI1/KNR4 family protein [Fusobacterium nucleatum]